MKRALDNNLLDALSKALFDFRQISKNSSKKSILKVVYKNLQKNL